MASRKVFTGTLGFGMVSVPVGMYNAVDEKPRVNFNNLHSVRPDGEPCHEKIKVKKLCPSCIPSLIHKLASDPTNANASKEDFAALVMASAELSEENLVKGYEIAKNQFIVMDESDFDAVPTAVAKRIEIKEFVPIESIDVRRYDKPYIVSPEPGGDRAFGLLLAATENIGKVAICTVAMRDKEHLASLRPFEGLLLLQMLLYDDELKPTDEFKKVSVKPSEKELDLATRLVESLTNETPDLSQYHDSSREAIMGIIEQKAEGKVIVPIVSKQEKPTTDLLAGLEASLAAVGKK